MSFTFELSFDDRVTVGQVFRFLELLRSAGAGEDTVLEPVPHDQDDSVPVGWAYRPSRLPEASDRAELRLPAPVVKEALDMLSSVIAAEGDVRMLPVAEVRDALHKAVMQELGFSEVGS